jgi:hypothetical protein
VRVSAAFIEALPVMARSPARANAREEMGTLPNS